MNLKYPSYYPRFSCIADQCRHNCCIGWEIDVDDSSLARYDKVGGAFGRRLKESIDRSSSPPCFILGKDDRCPFLSEKNLCDIILTLGEDALSEICTLHPRFRNLYSDRVEMGVGLTCEAAARLILSEASPFSLIDGEDEAGVIEPPTDEEIALRETRDRVFSLLTDRSLPLDTRKRQILAFVGGDDECIAPHADTVDFCLSLERLDDGYTDALNALKAHPEALSAPLPPAFALPEEQLLAYFLYRHLLPEEEDGETAARVRTALFLSSLCCAILALHLTEHPTATVEDFAEIARMVSSEIEYSESNTLDLIDYFYRLPLDTDG